MIHDHCDHPRRTYTSHGSTQRRTSRRTITSTTPTTPPTPPTLPPPTPPRPCVHVLTTGLAALPMHELHQRRAFDATFACADGHRLPSLLAPCEVSSAVTSPHS